MSEPGSLEREIAYFKSKRAEWLQHYTGQYALVMGEALTGTFTSFSEAYSVGVDRFGSDQFLVRQIVEHDAEQSLPALFVGALFASSL